MKVLLLILLSALNAASANAQANSSIDETSEREQPIRRRAEVRVVKVDKKVLTALTKDGSVHEIPFSTIRAHRRRNGRTELMLSNGLVLVDMTGEGSGLSDTDWKVVQRREAPKSPLKRSVRPSPRSTPAAGPGRKYSALAIELEKLILTSRPVVESRQDALDIRTVEFGLRDLNRAIDAGRWTSAAAHVSKMKAALERVRAIAQDAPQRIAKRDATIAERRREIDRLRLEINMLSHLIEGESAASPYPGVGNRETLAAIAAGQQRRARQMLKKRERLQRDLRKLEQQERDEVEFYERLEQESRI